MKKYMINVNGKSYEVEVEEVKGGAGQSASPAATPAPAVAPNPAPTPVPSNTCSIGTGKGTFISSKGKW